MEGWSTVENELDLHEVKIDRKTGLESCDGGGNDCDLHDVEIEQLPRFDSCDGAHECDLHDVEIEQIANFNSYDGGRDDCDLYDVEIEQITDFDSYDGGDNCDLHDAEIEEITNFGLYDGAHDFDLHDVEIEQVTHFDSYDGGDNCDSHDIESEQITNFGSFVKYDGGHGCAERLRGLFEEVLSCFENEVSECQNGKKVNPALLSDGQPVDLFKIFWAVWNRGGCDFVSKNGLWDSVAEECKIDCRIVEESVKVVYMKYVSELDYSLRRAINSKWSEKEKGEDGKIGLLLSELQKEFSSFLQERCAKNENGEVVVKRKNDGIYYDVDIAYVSEVCDIVRKNQKATNDDNDEKLGVFEGESNSKKRKREEHYANKENGKIVEFERKNDGIFYDVDIVCLNDDEEFGVVEGESGSKKRKQDSMSLSAMLNWVVEVAKHPDDLAIGQIPEFPKWKDHRKEDLWAQALLAREALLRTKCSNSTTEDSQKKLKMHPSMYEDGNNLTPQSAEKLRGSQRVHSVTKPRICPCCNSSSTFHSNVVSSHKAKTEKNPKEQAHPDVEISEPNGSGCSSKVEKPQKQISVGPAFEAKLPEWTGAVYESDSKWLGTRMWPPTNGKHFPNFETDSIENGRKQPCACQFPGSVACVRLHIAESRMKLRREIGLLFYHWRFDRMGEEVSLSWSIEEEKRFKLMVRLNLPCPSTHFWDDIAKFFPAKTKDKLVSYYFNVFLIGRRAYQNRVTPKDVDSDDDEESEFGCVGGRFGNEAPSFGGSDRLICAESKQHEDFEYEEQGPLPRTADVA